MKKPTNRNHFSIQIQYRVPNELPTELYKSTKESKSDAIKACIIKAKDICDRNKKYDPWKVEIIDQLTTEKHYQYPEQRPKGIS